jgi:hypothetical protein
MNNLEWIDESSGVFDESLWGTKYASGTNIIISNDVAKNIINNKNLLDYNLVDDLSIGVYINKYLPNIINNNNSELIKCFVSTENNNFDNIDNSILFFRNRSSNDRNLDLKNMKKICKKLYNIEEIKESFESIENYYLSKNDYFILIFGYIFFFFLFFLFFKKFFKKRIKIF